MATVKVKLRPSTVPGKAGTIYYQLTHLRQVKQITTKIHLQGSRPAKKNHLQNRC